MKKFVCVLLLITACQGNKGKGTEDVSPSPGTLETTYPSTLPESADNDPKPAEPVAETPAEPSEEPESPDPISSPEPIVAGEVKPGLQVEIPFVIPSPKNKSLAHVKLSGASCIAKEICRDHVRGFGDEALTPGKELFDADCGPGIYRSNAICPNRRAEGCLKVIEFKVIDSTTGKETKQRLAYISWDRFKQEECNARVDSQLRITEEKDNLGGNPSPAPATAK